MYMESRNDISNRLFNLITVAPMKLVSNVHTIAESVSITSVRKDDVIVINISRFL